MSLTLRFDLLSCFLFLCILINCYLRVSTTRGLMCLSQLNLLSCFQGNVCAGEQVQFALQRAVSRVGHFFDRRSRFRIDLFYTNYHQTITNNLTSHPFSGWDFCHLKDLILHRLDLYSKSSQGISLDTEHFKKSYWPSGLLWPRIVYRYFIYEKWTMSEVCMARAHERRYAHFRHFHQARLPANLLGY